MTASKKNIDISLNEFNFLNYWELLEKTGFLLLVEILLFQGIPDNGPYLLLVRYILRGTPDESASNFTNESA